MKCKTFLLLSYFTFNSFIALSQTSTIHLAFDKEANTRKYIDSKNRVNFRFNKEHFISLEERTTNSDSVSKINFTPFNEFIYLSNLIRQKLIREGEKEGIIKLLSNNDVFDNIYIYEKISDSLWCSYKAKWIDEIED